MSHANNVQAANFESAADGASAEDAAANDDTALMRFELIEVIVRIAFSKYVISKEIRDASNAVEELLANCILPGLPPLAFVDPNDFRFRRMYNEATEKVLIGHCDFLSGVFKVCFLAFIEIRGLPRTPRRSCSRSASCQGCPCCRSWTQTTFGSAVCTTVRLRRFL
jgi:hypothetical protein